MLKQSVYGGGYNLFRISEEGRAMQSVRSRGGPRRRMGRKGSMVLLSDGLSEANPGRFG